MAIRVLALLAFVLCCSTSYGEEAVEIPLKEIWAYQMPGTKYITEFDPFYDPPELTEKEWRERSVVRKIILRLAYPYPPEKKKTDQGFAVNETGIDALKQAEEILSGKTKPVGTFSIQDHISLFFHVRRMGAYVHLDEVKREGNLIRIRYHLVRHITQNSSINMALIPLGKLPPDRYSVKVMAGPQQFDAQGGEDQFKELTQPELDRYISGDFSFDVK